MSTEDNTPGERVALIFISLLFAFFLGGAALLAILDIVYSTLGHINPFGYWTCASLTLAASVISMCLRS